MSVWIEDPLGILADGAERGVVEGGAIPGLDMAALVRRHSAAGKALHAG
jgi:hypothetical protein